MTFLFYTLIIVTAYHFVWEAILAPSFRLGLRFELFRLRDELRWLHHKDPDDCTEEIFRCIQGSINNGIRLLPKTDFALLRSVDRAIAEDSGLKKRIEKRRELIEACINPEIREFERRISSVTRRALVVNTGGWIIYLIPVVLAAVCFGWVKRFVGKLRDALLVPEKELNRISPGGFILT